MNLPPTARPTQIREALLRDGYVVVDNVLSDSQTSILRAAIEGRIQHERDHPNDPGRVEISGDQAADFDFSVFETRPEEEELLRRRVRHHQATEFDTPWPVSANDVCISFIHIPTYYDNGRSQRVFNVINKMPEFAELAEHPLVLETIESELGQDLILLDASINQVGPHTSDGGWHVDSPLTQIEEPLPDLTLSIQTVWMLDDFTADNGGTHVSAGSNHTLRKPPPRGRQVPDEEIVEGPSGSVAFWLSQTWHRAGANTTDEARTGFIVQYGRAWVKPFVDMRTPMDAKQAQALSPRMRYMMGCNANAPVRG